MPAYEAPYWRLSCLYFFYFTAVGVVLPYWGLYLDALGFSAVQIGVVVSIPMVSKVLAPNLWGWLADRTGQYLAVIRLGALCAVVFFAGVVWRQDFWGLLIFAACFSFFWNAILPQFEVITLDALTPNVHHYAKVRLWGSLGFIASVVALGGFFESQGVACLPWVLWGLLLAILAATWLVPNRPLQRAVPHANHFWQSLRRSSVAYFFAASVLLHISHGVFYGFYSLHLQQHGYSSTAIGLLWALGVVAEVAVFAKIPAIFRAFSLYHCYLVGFIAAVIRWCVVALFPEHVGVMLVAQLLHALTFGVTHAVAIEIVRQSFADSDRGKAQALYSAVCFGAGGALGAISSGLLWEQGGAVSFVFAAVAAASGAALVLWGMSAYRQP